jgi:hypothetical protein
MLGINLLHGWLYDPQDTDTATTIKDLSYNQVFDPANTPSYSSHLLSALAITFDS